MGSSLPILLTQNPMSDIAEKIQETVEQTRDSRLNGMIALFVAVVATIMALCNVKAGNVTQAMQQAQAKSSPLFGLAGFLQWNLHSELMAKLLG